MKDLMQERNRLCKSLGLTNIANAHKIIVTGAHKGGGWLQGKGLNCARLESLGYNKEILKKLGYKNRDLERLGFLVKTENLSSPAKSAEPASPGLERENTGKRMDVRSLVNQGYRASQLKQKGINVHTCKTCGMDARELYQLDFRLDEIAREYGLRKMKAAGFLARDMARFFRGDELRMAGYSSREMRVAGFSVRDLLNFGYPPNQVIEAGFSTRELIQEGLSTHTQELDRF